MFNLGDIYEQLYFYEDYDNEVPSSLMDYDALRLFLREDLEQAAPEDVEDAFYEAFDEAVNVEDMEFAWGALIPAAISAVGSLINLIGQRRRSRQTTSRRRAAAPATPTPAPSPRQTTPTQAPTQPTQTGSPPVATQGGNAAGLALNLLQTMLNPQMLNSIMAIISNISGRRSMQNIDGENVPVAEYINLLRVAVEDLQEALQQEGYFDDITPGEDTEDVSIVPESRAYRLMETVVEENAALAEAYEQELAAYETIEALYSFLDPIAEANSDLYG